VKKFLSALLMATVAYGTDLSVSIFSMSPANNIVNSVQLLDANGKPIGSRDENFPLAVLEDKNSTLTPTDNLNLLFYVLDRNTGVCSMAYSHNIEKNGPLNSNLYQFQINSAGRLVVNNGELVLTPKTKLFCPVNPNTTKTKHLIDFIRYCAEHELPVPYHLLGLDRPQSVTVYTGPRPEQEDILAALDTYNASKVAIFVDLATLKNQNHLYSIDEKVQALLKLPYAFDQDLEQESKSIIEQLEGLPESDAKEAHIKNTQSLLDLLVNKVAANTTSILRSIADFKVNGNLMVIQTDRDFDIIISDLRTNAFNAKTRVENLASSEQQTATLNILNGINHQLTMAQTPGVNFAEIIERIGILRAKVTLGHRSADILLNLIDVTATVVKLYGRWIDFNQKASMQPTKVSLAAPGQSQEHDDVLFMRKLLNDPDIWEKLIYDLTAGPEQTWELPKTAQQPPVNNLVME
jgi:hypothetical protein